MHSISCRVFALASVCALHKQLTTAAEILKPSGHGMPTWPCAISASRPSGNNCLPPPPPPLQTSCPTALCLCSFKGSHMFPQAPSLTVMAGSQGLPLTTLWDTAVSRSWIAPDGPEVIIRLIHVRAVATCHRA